MKNHLGPNRVTNILFHSFGDLIKKKKFLPQINLSGIGLIGYKKWFFL